MGRRVLNRKELRADYEAAERQKPDEDEVDEVEEEVEDDEEEEEDAEAAEGEEEPGEEDEEEGDEEAPKKKRKPVKVPKPKAKPRSRTPKITRMKVVWGVFNNSNQSVATFDYPKRKDADDLAAKLTGDKKNTHFVQPVKVPIEEKKE
jgi:hypothetical protein